MSGTRTPQVAFSSGELDPLLRAREDFQRHQTGLAICRGFLPLRQGGVTRAPGTVFKGYTRNNSEAIRVPFVFAKNDAVSIELTPGKMRFWRYGELVRSNGDVYEIDTPFEATDLKSLSVLQDADVAYLSTGRLPVMQLSRLDLTDWQLTEAEFENGPFLPQNLNEDLTIRLSNMEGTSDIELWQPNEILEIGELRKSITRVYEFLGVGTDAEVLVDGSCGETAPTHLQGDAAVTVPNSGQSEPLFARWRFRYDTTISSGPISLHSSSDLFDDLHKGALFRFVPTDWTNIATWVGEAEVQVGTLIRFDGNVYEVLGAPQQNPDPGGIFGGLQTIERVNTGVNAPVHTSGTVRTDASKPVRYRHVSTEAGIVRISTVIDAQNAQGDVVQPIPQPCVDDPTYRWSEGAWNSLRGHPAYITLHQQRMFAAGTKHEPRTVSASTQGAFRDFEPSANSDGSFSYDIGGNGSRNSINWLFSGRRGVYIGSLGEVRRGHANGAQEGIGPLTFDQEIVSEIGAAAIDPIGPFGWPVYISRDQARVLEVRYNYSEDGMRPIDLSLPSQHLGAQRFEQIVWQSAPVGRIWLRRSDGTLCCLTYDPDQDVIGWALVPIAGGYVEHLEVTPSEDATHEVVTVVVRRSLGGQNVRCVEEMAINVNPLNGAQGIEHFNHAFCSSVFSSETEFDTLEIPHLAGEEVFGWSDMGAIDGLVVPASGTVRLPHSVKHVIIGLMDATHAFRTLSLRAPSRSGDARGRKLRNLSDAGVLVHRSCQGWVRGVETKEGGAPYLGSRKQMVSNVVGAPGVSPVSGVLPLDFPGGHADEVSVQIEPEGLAPLTVLGLVPNVSEVGD